MAKKEVKVAIPGINFLSILGLVFVVLKLTGTISWSWFWVLAPFWIIILISILIIIGILLLFSL